MTCDTMVKDLPTMATFTVPCGCQYLKLLQVGRYFRVKRVKICPSSCSGTDTGMVHMTDKVEWDAFTRALHESFA